MIFVGSIYVKLSYLSPWFDSVTTQKRRRGVANGESNHSFPISKENLVEVWYACKKQKIR